VPDGLHPDPEYIEWARPGGSGSGALDHKVLYDYHSLEDVLQAAGFQVRRLEYFDEEGRFHFATNDVYLSSPPVLRRSYRLDRRT
jgi:predicted SAM-dependent methyltransferase